MSPGLKISGLRRPLFASAVCLILLSSLLFLVSELSIILCGMVGSPGNFGARLRKSSAGDPDLSGHCSQLRVWHTNVMPGWVPSKCAMAALTLFTACSASLLDRGE